MNATIRMVQQRRQTNTRKRAGAGRAGRARRGGGVAYLQTRFRFMVALGPMFGFGPGLLGLAAGTSSRPHEQGEIVLRRHKESG